MMRSRELVKTLLAAYVFCICGVAVAEHEDAVGLNNRGIAQLRQGDAVTAIGTFREAARMDPGNGTIAMNLVSAYLRHAEEYVRLGEYKDAVYWLDWAMSVGVDDPTIENNIAATYNQIANAYSTQKRYREAVSLLQTAVTIMPQNSVIRVNLGIALLNDNRKSEALVEFKSVLAMESEHALALAYCGRIHYDLGELKESLEELTRASELNPSDTGVKSLLKKVKREYELEKEFDVDKHTHFTVSFDGDRDYRTGYMVIDALEAAWLKVGQDFNFYPRERIAVVIYSGRQFRDLLNKPKNVGGLYDGKIRIPVGGLDSARDQEVLRHVLTHEYAHVEVHLLTHNRCPLWLNEGIAEYESRSWDEADDRQLAAALSEGSFIPLKNLSGALKSIRSSRMTLAYTEAFSVVRYIAGSFGAYNLRWILDRLNAGDDAETALKRILSIGMEQLEREWVRTLR